ncbi:MAG: hypothetical protein ACREBI_11545 [Nitrosotalea sp.]
MAFLGNNKAGTPDFKWQYAIVDLKAPSSSASISCDIDWWAWVQVDLTTKKVVSADYPSAASHICRGPAGSPAGSPGYSMAEQTDVNSGSNSYYGNYAELNAPSVNTSIFSHLNGAYVEQLVNAEFNPSSGCTNVDCLEQGGWLVTAFACSGCSISANTMDIVYVDESVHNNQQDYNTGLKWTNSVSTIYSEIDCAYTTPDYGINISNGTNSFTETTTISCTTPQLAFDSFDNSVWLENWDSQASSNWSSYFGTVSATNAQEYKGSYNSVPISWSGSANKDGTCSGSIVSPSQVITSGNLASGTTATWASLTHEPVGC